MRPRRATPARGPIDWQEVRARLARSAAATEAALVLSPERAREVMEERAHRLALVPPEAPSAAERLEIVTFALAHEHYAVETKYVREVLPCTEYTPAPGAPDFLVGVLNLRGEVLAIFDLRKFFRLAARGVTDLARVLVLGGERPEFGVLADSADEVTLLRLDEVHEPPATVAGIGRDYLRGVTADALIVLDGAVLLRDGRLFIDQSEEGGAS